MTDNSQSFPFTVIDLSFEWASLKMINSIYTLMEFAFGFEYISENHWKFKSRDILKIVLCPHLRISLLSADSSSCWQSRDVTWASLGIACRRTQEAPKKRFSNFHACFISETSSSNCRICIIGSQTLWPQTGKCTYGLFIFSPDHIVEIYL